MPRQRDILIRASSRNQREQRRFIDLEYLVIVREAMPQTNLLYRKFRDFKFHDPSTVQIVPIKRFESFSATSGGRKEGFERSAAVERLERFEPYFYGAPMILRKS